MICDINNRFGVTLDLEATCFLFIVHNETEPFYQCINQCLMQYLIDESAPMDVNCPNSVSVQNSQKKNIILGMIQDFYETYTGECDF